MHGITIGGKPPNVGLGLHENRGFPVGFPLKPAQTGVPPPKKNKTIWGLIRRLPLCWLDRRRGLKQGLGRSTSATSQGQVLVAMSGSIRIEVLCARDAGVPWSTRRCDAMKVTLPVPLFFLSAVSNANLHPRLHLSHCMRFGGRFTSRGEVWKRLRQPCK